MAKTSLFCCIVLFIHATIAQYGYNPYGYVGYPNYNYGYGTYPQYGYQQQQQQQQYPNYGYYPGYGYYPNYGTQQQAGYPYYTQNQAGYAPNSYYGNGLNQAYASSAGGTATAQATSGNAGGGYFG